MRVCMQMIKNTCRFPSHALHRLHSCSIIHVLSPGAHARIPFIIPAPSRHEGSPVCDLQQPVRIQRKASRPWNSAREPLTLRGPCTPTAGGRRRRPERSDTADAGSGATQIRRYPREVTATTRRPSGLATRYAMSGSNYLAISLIIESYATFHVNDSRHARAVVAPGSRHVLDNPPRLRTYPLGCTERTTQCARN